jgi:hypothetical protein
MSTTRHFTRIAVASLFVAACGGAPAADGPPQPGNVMVEDGDGQRKTGALATAPGGGFDLAPVKEPGAMVLHVRWSNPGKTLATAANYASLPSGVVNTGLKQLTIEVLEDAIGDSINTELMADVVSLDAPLDIVGVANTKRSRQVPEPMMAWSIGLTSAERALEASKGKPINIGEGVWRIGTESRWGTPCAVARSAGSTPARLVCTESERHLEVMVPYMARNVANMPLPKSDLRMEMKMRGVFDKYGRQWANQARGLPIIAEEFKIGIPQFDNALFEAADALAGEAGALINDADSVVTTISLDQKKGITLGFELGFNGKKSWTVQTIVDGANKAGAAPNIFWHAPQKSETVTFARGGNVARWEPINRTLRALLEGIMAREKVGTAADRKAITKLLRVPLGDYVPSMSANGHFMPAKGAAGTFDDILDATVGWYLFGFEEGPTKMRSYLNDVVRVYNRPGLQRLIKKEMGSDAKHLPRVRIVPAPRALGAGSLAIEVTIPQIENPMDESMFGSSPVPTPLGGPVARTTKPIKTIDVKFHVLLMSDSGRTWVGLAAKRDQLASIMETAKGSTPSASTIAGRRGLDVFRRGKHSGGGMTSLEGLIGSVKPAIMMFTAVGPGATQGPAEQIMQAIERMPNKGRTPIIALGTIDGGAKPSIALSLNVPDGTLKDVGYLVTEIIAIVQRNP